jgi:hypothetical protein
MGCQHEGFWKEGKLSHWIKTVEVEDMAKNEISSEQLSQQSSFSEMSKVSGEMPSQRSKRS